MSKKPNVIIINCDDLGWGDLSCYGSSMNNTPFLDKLAEDGMRLTNFYAASSVCSPSRAALLTGCYPQRVGVERVLFPGDELGLSQEEMTIAKSLKKVGYSTALVGKWHCGDQKEFLPTKHGFDYYYGLPYSNDMGMQRRDHDVPGKRPPLPLLKNEVIVEEQPDQSALTYRYLEHSLFFIESNKDKPFFLYLAHMYVHVPLYVPKKFLDEAKNPYEGAVAVIDWTTGVIMDYLEKHGLSKNTIIIFTSDNGSRCDYDKSNGDLRGIKATTWEGGQKVPCIIKWPENIDKGKTNDKLCTMIDLLPTICSICGAPLPERKIDGVDLSSLLLEDKKNNSETLMRETFAYYFLFGLCAFRWNQWKLHFYRFNRVDHRDNLTPCLELYNLEEDPNETKEVSSNYLDIVKKINSLANKMRSDLGDSFLNMNGNGRRSGGKVSNPKTLTNYDPNHLYFMAEYDLSEVG